MRVRIDGTPDEVETALDTLDLVLTVGRRTRQLRLWRRSGQVRVYAVVLDERVPAR